MIFTRCFGATLFDFLFLFCMMFVFVKFQSIKPSTKELDIHFTLFEIILSFYAINMSFFTSMFVNSVILFLVDVKIVLFFM